MTKQAAKIWIENNPDTGDLRPFEVWFQVASKSPQKIAHCATLVGAEKSIKATIKRNAQWYEVQVGV